MARRPTEQELNRLRAIATKLDGLKRIQMRRIREGDTNAKLEDILALTYGEAHFLVQLIILS